MRNSILTVLFCLPFLVFAQDNEAKSDFAKEFGPVWERAKEFTLEVAEAMPAEKYQYRPNEEVDTYAGHLIHTANNWFGLCGRFVKEEGWPLDDEIDSETATKEEVIKHLKASFAYADEAFYGLTDEELESEAPKFWSKGATKKVVLMLMRDHMTHHRGALVIYLRENGIKPPRYRGW